MIKFISKNITGDYNGRNTTNFGTINTKIDTAI